MPREHPLVPSLSSRISLSLQESRTEPIISDRLPRRSLDHILRQYPLAAIQAQIVQARSRAIVEAQILLKRNLNYNLRHRSLRSGTAECTLAELRAGQTAALHNIVQQLWLHRGSKQSANQGPARSNKVFHGPFAFFPLQIEALSSYAGTEHDGKMEVSLRCAVLPGPKSADTAELDRAIVKAAPMLTGELDENGMVSFGEKGFCFRRWGQGNRLVVKIGGLTRSLDVQGNTFRSLRFERVINIVRPEQFRMCAVLKWNGPMESVRANGAFSWNGSIPPTARTNFDFVFLYNSGSNLQVREMVALQCPPSPASTTCVLCGMICISLATLLRHLEGLHPGVGFEYDSERMRLYFWFVPEMNLIRWSVPGFHHNDVFVVKGRRKIFKFHLKPFYRARESHVNGIMILDWKSHRYCPGREEDSLPVFSRDRVIQAYGVPITVDRQKFVHMHGVRICRPDRASLHTFDSDEENDLEETDRRIHDLVDCSQLEKRFMSLWNRFVGNAKIYTYEMAAMLEHFVRTHGTDIEMMDCYPLFVAHVIHLQRSHVIRHAELRAIMRFYRQTVRL